MIRRAMKGFVAWQFTTSRKVLDREKK